MHGDVESDKAFAVQCTGVGYMKELVLQVTHFANGGAVMGRDGDGRAVFVPFAIPGELVRVEVHTEKKHYARGKVVALLEGVESRVVPRCDYFMVCGGCHFQHMVYGAQLKAKQAIVADQLERIGGFVGVAVADTMAHPSPWG